MGVCFGVCVCIYPCIYACGLIFCTVCVHLSVCLCASAREAKKVTLLWISHQNTHVPRAGVYLHMMKSHPSEKTNTSRSTAVVCACGYLDADNVACCRQDDVREEFPAMRPLPMLGRNVLAIILVYPPPVYAIRENCVTSFKFARKKDTVMKL
jgi:hypothetical protein